MAYRNESRTGSTALSEAHAHLLTESLEQYNGQQRTKRPLIIFSTLLVLFLSSAGGIALAIGLMAKVVDIGAGSLPRDLILFAGAMSLLYICLHIRGARKDYRKIGPGPPQSYGGYLHACALLVARLSIIIWIAALVATAIMIARTTHFEGFVGKVPFLNLLICIGAIPSFLIISITIEKNPRPFATTAISTPSFLTCRVSEFEDDLATDWSVSRRTSLQQKQGRTRSILTLPTELFWARGTKFDEEKGDRLKRPDSVTSEKTQPKADESTSDTHPTLPSLSPVSPLYMPPIPRAADVNPVQEAPQPTYCPGGWRAEWNDVDQGVGESPLTKNPVVGLSANPSGPSHQGAPHAPDKMAPPPRKLQQPITLRNSTAGVPVTNNAPKQQRQSQPRRPAAKPSTSIASSAARSNLSTVRYASQPEIAVRQPIRVVPNPAYLPSSGAAEDEWHGKPVTVSKPDPVALLRSAQRAQRTVGVVHGPRAKPSNFSRPTEGPRRWDGNGR
ncbi:hypothetical protein SAMD00023353_4700100 [Rosellinia necatrix]|uniref:Uncharacterized protein n=1 Tax=Rosellinia necatrix TaxID=77044 RepID=A0A1S8A9V5_ROSNE|nr:hypothetical protein SAMD00023353_4700100 [Rosellinia necatrix]